MQRKLAPCPSTPANPSPTAPPTSPPPRAPVAMPSSVKSPMRNFLLAHLTRRVPRPAVFRVRVFHFAKTLKLVILGASDKDARRTSPSISSNSDRQRIPLFSAHSPSLRYPL